MPLWFLAILKNKFFWIISISITILLFVYFNGKSAGKRKANVPPKDTPLPNSGGGIPVVGRDPKTGKAVSWDPKPLSDEAHSVMDGLLTDTASKEGLWAKLTALTDDQLTAVYNHFNKNHYSEGYGTLTQWVKDETGALWSSNKPKLLARFELLRLN